MNKWMLTLSIILISLQLVVNQDDMEYDQDDTDNEDPTQDPTKVANIVDFIATGKAQKYLKKIRPIGLNESDPLKPLIIKLMISYRQLISLDEKNQILTSSFYLLLNWADYRLTWEPSDYGNVKEVITSANDFWLPDLAVINAASNPNTISYPGNLNCLITYDGQMFVTVAVPIQLTRCKLDVYKYPFDTQTCTITIGSWAFSTKDLDFESLTPTLQFLTAHPIWQLKSVRQRTQLNRNRFDLVNMNYVTKKQTTVRAEDVQLVLTLKRNPLYIMINGIVPCFILNCVVLISFTLPYAQQVGLSIINNE